MLKQKIKQLIKELKENFDQYKEFNRLFNKLQSIIVQNDTGVYDSDELLYMTDTMYNNFIDQNFDTFKENCKQLIQIYEDYEN
ncbi:MAG: hypothetical protein LBM96_05985 [Methanobrevibacter sp.]|jgi:hypothetical protein|nr:hypothetical protein [Candidatus Methanoflexus mossambicus]